MCMLKSLQVFKFTTGFFDGLRIIIYTEEQSVNVFSLLDFPAAYL